MNRNLELKPLRRYRDPEYPTKEEADRSPELLHAIPIRWKHHPLLCSVLVFTVASGLCSCASKQKQPEPASAVEPLIPPDGDEARTEQQNAPETSDLPAPLEIPVFAHGIGRGSYGCESVAPPVFLSEEEAAQVIREEALLQGVDFSGQKTIEAELPVTNLYGDEQFQNSSVRSTLELDGYDEALGIGFEFVSQKDVVSWKQDGNMASSVENYEMKDASERLHADNTAVFYDPGADWRAFSYNWENGNGEAYDAYVQSFTENQKQAMKEQLREQVRDFLQWLQGQGII